MYREIMASPSFKLSRSTTVYVEYGYAIWVNHFENGYSIWVNHFEIDLATKSCTIFEWVVVGKPRTLGQMYEVDQ